MNYWQEAILQAKEYQTTLALLGSNSPLHTRVSLLLANDEYAQTLGKLVTRHEHLRQIEFTLLDVRDSTIAVKELVDYVRRQETLTAVSIVTAFLIDEDGQTSLGGRELVVEAFMKAMAQNRHIETVSLNCCSYCVDLLADIVANDTVKHLCLANCRSREEKVVTNKSSVHLVDAFKRSSCLETVRIRRSFESSTLESKLLNQLSTCSTLTALGTSVRDLGTAIELRRVIETTKRQMSFALLGCELDLESAVILLRAFQIREHAFTLEMQQCTWSSVIVMETFFSQLLLCQRLSGLAVDQQCGLDKWRIRELEEAVASKHRRTSLQSNLVPLLSLDLSSRVHGTGFRH